MIWTGTPDHEPSIPGKGLGPLIQRKKWSHSYFIICTTLQITTGVDQQLSEKPDLALIRSCEQRSSMSDQTDGTRRSTTYIWSGKLSNGTIQWKHSSVRIHRSLNRAKLTYLGRVTVQLIQTISVQLIVDPYKGHTRRTLNHRCRSSIAQTTRRLANTIPPVSRHRVQSFYVR